MGLGVVGREALALATMNDGRTPEVEAIARVLTAWLASHGYPIPDHPEHQMVSASWLLDELNKVDSDNPATDMRSREARRWREAVDVIRRCIKWYLEQNPNIR